MMSRRRRLWATVAQAEELVETSIAMEIDGVGYVEDPSLTAQCASRDGVRAWYRGFGGDLGPTTTSTLCGDYNASASGMVLGADVSIGSNVQIGAFANYGDVSLYQFLVRPVRVPGVPRVGAGHHGRLVERQRLCAGTDFGVEFLGQSVAQHHCDQ